MNRYVSYKEVKEFVSEAVGRLHYSAVAFHLEYDYIAYPLRGGRFIAETFKEFLESRRDELGIKSKAEVIPFHTDCVEEELSSKLKAYDTILLVDDISDSGLTLRKVVRDVLFNEPKLKIVTYTPFIRHETKLVPNYFNEVLYDDTWLNFEWEKDYDEKGERV